MSHCPGCGGHFTEGRHKNFKHILGCGWVFDKPDGRAAPSSVAKQTVIIETGLAAAESAKSSGDDPADAFIKAVLKALNKHNEP